MTQAYKNSRILVTGGAGFIGSHLTEQLVAVGAQVTVVDNLSTGSPENLAAVWHKINFIQGDITDASLCKEAVRGTQKIFHLAALASVPLATEQPELCFAENVTGTFNLLEAARLHGVQKFIFSSSSAVYGQTDIPCSEDQAPAPTSVYGYSKLIGEQLCEQYTKLYQLTTVRLRYFNVYGERQSSDAVVAAFKQKMAQNLPITLQGSGLQQRDFVPVAKVVEANLLLGMSQTENCYNIGTGTSISLLTLIEQLKLEFPTYHQPLQFAPARQGDIHYSAADCTRYQTLRAHTQ